MQQLKSLAEVAGFVVESMREDKRLMVNRADKTRMQRVWLVATLRKATPVADSASGASVAAWALQRLLGAKTNPLWWPGTAMARRGPISFGAGVAAGVAALALARLGSVLLRRSRLQ